MQRLGIRHQVLLLALVPTLTVAILLVAYFTSTRLQDLEQNFRERGEAITLKLAPAGEYGVFSRNKPVLQNLAQAALKEHEVKSVSFYTEEGVEIARAGSGSLHFKMPQAHSLSTQLFVEENDSSIAWIVPVTTYQEMEASNVDLPRTQTHIGWLMVELDTAGIHLRAYHVLLHTGLILLLGLGISGLHALHMGKNVTRPILELVEGVKSLREGDLNTRIKSTNYHELQVLESGINSMAESLQKAQTDLQNEVNQATGSLRRSLEMIEIQNVELEIARQTAEKASHIKSEFLADMSHEIRTPLNAIVGFIRLLQKTDLNQKQTDYLSTLQKSTKVLLSIINNILDFSKIEAGKLRIEQMPLFIRECVEDTLNLLTPHAEEKSITLTPLIYSDIPAETKGDPLRLKQVITNLVNNAIKFTDQGSVTVRVMLEKEYIKEFRPFASVKISITDTGIGLSLSEQQQLFQAFNQVKDEISHKHGGTGLGLAISKKLVEQMKGSIGVESTIGKGATFWFTFEVELLKDKKQLAPKKVSYDPLLNSSLSVLAVDDNPENLLLISVLLQELGASVTTASSGYQALDIIQTTTRPFTLILMDIRMPKLNGIETTHAIRAFELKNGLKYTPIIALTAHAFISEQEALLSAGIDDCLIKPIDETDLQTLIRKWTEPPPPPIDWELSLKLVGGKIELAQELLNKLITSLPQEQDRIQRAFQERNWAALRDWVHRLHGACCYCGVPILKRSVQNLEKSISTRTVDIIKPRMDALNESIDSLLNHHDYA
jgi:two-component system sensor histidine kinase BarA